MLWLIVAGIVGLVVLARGADMFVTAAARISAVFGLSAVIVGAVVIGFGTSLPELVVATLAAAGGDADLAVGAVVGSTIANVTLVLGLAGLLGPIVVTSSTLRREAPMSVGAVLLFAAAVMFGFAWFWAAILAAAMFAVAVVVVRTSRNDASHELADEVEAELGDDTRPLWRVWAAAGVGAAAVAVGAHLLVTSASGFAEMFGLSSGVVGVTIVAVGTSLPELAATVAAARRNEMELVVGNVLGSNVFNTLAVGAATIAAAPGAAIDPLLAGPLLAAAVGVSVLAYALMAHGYRLTRLNGALLACCYVALVPLMF